MQRILSSRVACSLVLASFAICYTSEAPADTPPEVSADIEDLYCRGDDVVIQLRATDPDGDPVAFTIDPAGDDLPEGLTLGTRSGRIEGILRRTDGEGSSTGYDITVVATDPGGLSSAVTFNLFSIACEEPRIARFVLVDTQRDVDVRILEDADVIKLGWLQGRFSVRVEVYPETPAESFTGVIAESVGFVLDGRRIRTESVAPYVLGGDPKGNYVPFPISAGQHSLTAIPFGANNAGGAQGPAKTLTFQVVD